MVEEGIYLDNYPDILMPHENRNKTNKGIQNLRRREQKMLIKALCSKDNRCRFIRLPKPNQSTSYQTNFYQVMTAKLMNTR